VINCVLRRAVVGLGARANVGTTGFLRGRLGVDGWTGAEVSATGCSVGGVSAGVSVRDDGSVSGGSGAKSGRGAKGGKDIDWSPGLTAFSSGL